MSGQQPLQTATAPAHQPHGRRKRAYTVAQLCDALEMSRRTFFSLRSAKQLPFLEELKPRLGRVVRYRADPIERYLENRWNRKVG